MFDIINKTIKEQGQSEPKKAQQNQDLNYQCDDGKYQLKIQQDEEDIWNRQSQMERQSQIEKEQKKEKNVNLISNILNQLETCETQVTDQQDEQKSLNNEENNKVNSNRRSIKKTGFFKRSMSARLNTKNMLEEVLLEKQKEMEEKAEKKSHEKELQLWKFIIEISIVFYTSTNLILQVIIDSKETVFYIYSLSTIARVGYYFYQGFYLADTKWNALKEFVRADDLFILTAISIVSYIFQNSSAEDVNTQDIITSGFAFFALLISYTGSFRCLIKYMKWNKCKHQTYKWIQIYSIIFYMIVGTMTLSKGAEGYNKDLYLLYVFTYLGYLCQVLSLINGIEIDKEVQEIEQEKQQAMEIKKKQLEQQKQDESTKQSQNQQQQQIQLKEQQQKQDEQFQQVIQMVSLGGKNKENNK